MQRPGRVALDISSHADRVADGRRWRSALAAALPAALAETPSLNVAWALHGARSEKALTS